MSDSPRPREAESLLRREELLRCASRGTGKGVRVAILDTGVDASHPALEGCVKACYEVVQEGRGLVCRPSDETDPVGHGTACAGILHQSAPEAEITSVRVMGKTAMGTGEQFLYGLHWALEVGEFRIVNLSLGTLQQRFQAALHELADRAYWRRCLLVAAAHNRGLPSYPASFASLVAVDSRAFADPEEFRFVLDKPVEIEAHGVQVRAPSPGGKYQVWSGTSFACPRVAGLAARLVSEIPGLTPFELKTFLKSLQLREPDRP